MAINKVIFGGETLIDLTGDTIAASDVINSKTFHDKSGTVVTGTCTYDSDTSTDTASSSEILANKTAHARGSKLTGTMTNNGAVTGTISNKTDQYTIPNGYHDGSGKVSIASAEQTKLIGGNIKSGVTILGVLGTYTGAAISSQSKTATPTRSQQIIQPDTGYDYLSQVTVKEIPYVESDNAAGGKTATIG